MRENQLVSLLGICLRAGNEILDVYEQDFEVEIKADHSPLTQADKRAHRVIVEGLEALDAQYPILSEEGAEITYGERKGWNRFWLVDPLDGTKEFVKKNGEFTVNIALIEDNYPVQGAIYAPVLDTFYYGIIGEGAYKLENASKAPVTTEEELFQASSKLPETNDPGRIHVVASRSHMSEETRKFIDDQEAKGLEVDVLSAGSSLKFCLVAEGRADFYPRFAPTMEWDTGAGQAIVEAAGGTVIRHDNNERLDYNREDLTNPWFLVKMR
ncbi:3'(2'),5'-bisphosphate nucleotidase CysQ [Sediminibacillus massiliensis]|uniref:3'(2'),5'-bisphosphate nucleotidase CysQ n=1 Tax=Sediminibacillus massiliensis TaxID=1926277 RepID=UPI0009885608|nr:3'(2'),5'-bisphosphate nucleotidase CysQ [Sediminibacillus massiliensis]